MGLVDNRLVILVLRAAQALFASIVLGLTVWIAFWWSHYWNSMSPASVNFLLFCAVWALLALLYLSLAPFLGFLERSKWTKMSLLVVEALTTMFWIAGTVALAIFLSKRVCFGSVCTAARAATAFGSMECLAFMFTTALAAMHLRSGSGGTARVFQRSKGPAIGKV
ncbi:unnamed protein product [Zymoseptoria tritici ST99CH_1A5]|uniref:MARVEL domain-containing protein n=3 Tax=Zymoseptoria tritici TaxID=1047171 RepID=A0A1X7RK51_ZYMT9|nr:unnamed protein product [Zymoseptoria tritici ST99CH_3D7]SMR46316.1 unnamed protein product [Zymoseptoria tritici ST99CH_1E4]SMR47565.1 unnamed protein product [Zymoseptoria tritici ST99CH_3D1]SMY21468.1 unnamed protein product [Zymoseptoria tritici ST99CH_1A5]